MHDSTRTQDEMAMTDKTLQDRLREHRVILKSGEYDGAQLMAAWCDMVNAAGAIDAKEARIKALEGAIRKLTMPATPSGYGYVVPTREWVDEARALLGETNAE